MLSLNIRYILRVDGYVVFIFWCSFIDFQIIDMCLTEDNRSHSNQTVYLKSSDAGCLCNLTGFVSRVEILQAISVQLLILSNNNNLFGIKMIFVYRNNTLIFFIKMIYSRSIWKIPFRTSNVKACIRHWYNCSSRQSDENSEVYPSFTKIIYVFWTTN